MKPNIIPAYAELEYYLRTPSRAELHVLKAKAEMCFRSAAVATGCEVNMSELQSELTNLSCWSVLHLPFLLRWKWSMRETLLTTYCETQLWKICMRTMAKLWAWNSPQMKKSSAMLLVRGQRDKEDSPLQTPGLGLMLVDFG